MRNVAGPGDFPIYSVGSMNVQVLIYMTYTQPRMIEQIGKDICRKILSWQKVRELRFAPLLPQISIHLNF